MFALGRCHFPPDGLSDRMRAQEVEPACQVPFCSFTDLEAQFDRGLSNSWCHRADRGDRAHVASRQTGIWTAEAWVIEGVEQLEPEL